MTFKEKFEQMSEPFSKNELENIFLDAADKNFIFAFNGLLEHERPLELLTNIKNELIDPKFKPQIEKFILFTPDKEISLVRTLLNSFKEKASIMEKGRMDSTLSELEPAEEIKLSAVLSQKCGINKFIEHVLPPKNLPPSAENYPEARNEYARIFYNTQNIVEIGYKLGWEQGKTPRWLTLSACPLQMIDNSEHKEILRVLTLFVCSPIDSNPLGVASLYDDRARFFLKLNEDSYEDSIAYAYLQASSPSINLENNIGGRNLVGHGLNEKLTSWLWGIYRRFSHIEEARHDPLRFMIPVPVGPSLEMQFIGHQWNQHEIMSKLDSISSDLNHLR